MDHPIDSPGNVARALFRALQEERWAEAVALVDARIVREHYEWWRQQLRGGGRRAQIELRVARRGGSQPTDAGGARSAMNVTFQHQPVHSFGEPIGVTDVEELERLTPADVLVRAATHRHSEGLLMRARSLREQGLEAAAAAPPARLLHVVLAEAQEFDDLAHVLYRRLLCHGELTELWEPVEVLSLVRTEEGWRITQPWKVGLGHQVARHILPHEVNWLTGRR